LPQDPTIASSALDGSVVQLTRLLRELVELTGEEAGPVPTLELQFGDILTRTTVQASDGGCLLITAMLPKCDEPGYVALAGASASEIEYLWHADEGCHVGVRRVPVRELPDERSVMDAIMATSDQAAAWFADLCGDTRRD
jgi:hypothetical protein